MKFVNVSGVDLDFVLAGTRYTPRAHETIDVPDRYAYAVKAHGLPLDPDGPLPGQAVASKRAAAVVVDVDSEDGDDPPPFSEPAPAVEPEPEATDASADEPADVAPVASPTPYQHQGRRNKHGR